MSTVKKTMKTITKQRFVELLAENLTEEQQRFYLHLQTVGRNDEIALELDFNKTVQENIKLFILKIDRLLEKERKAGEEDVAVIDDIMSSIELVRVK